MLWIARKNTYPKHLQQSDKFSSNDWKLSGKIRLQENTNRALAVFYCDFLCADFSALPAHYYMRLLGFKVISGSK